MTTVQALAVIWVATMIVLGLVWQRLVHWKARHDFDHELAADLHALLVTMQPTDATWQRLQAVNAHRRDFPIEFRVEQ